jgi:hypothetical protein
LQTGSDVGGVTEGKLFTSPFSTDLADDDQAGAGADTHPESRKSLLPEGERARVRGI